MSEYIESGDPLMDILDAIACMTIKPLFEDPLNGDDRAHVIHRGLPLEDNAAKFALHNQLCVKKHRELLSKKINNLKASVLRRDRQNGLEIIASLLGELLQPDEKIVFVNQFNENSSDDENRRTPSSSGNSSKFQNPEYIPVAPSQTQRHNAVQPVVPQIRKIDEPVPKEDSKLKLPIESHYNLSEVYLIHRGIEYSRSRLKVSIQKSRNDVLKELKSYNVLQVIMTEAVGKEENNYIKKLAKNFPNSLPDIKYILNEDRNLILKSSIFVNMAQENIQNLHIFLKQLLPIVDDNTLSISCQQSQDNGVTLLSILNQEYPPDVKHHADSIIRFMNRYRKGSDF